MRHVLSGLVVRLMPRYEMVAWLARSRTDPVANGKSGPLMLARAGGQHCHAHEKF
jgi:hypothetical protein